MRLAEDRDAALEARGEGVVEFLAELPEAGGSGAGEAAVHEVEVAVGVHEVPLLVVGQELGHVVVEAILENRLHRIVTRWKWVQVAGKKKFMVKKLMQQNLNEF